MTKPRLKRCPFDGGKAEYATERNTYPDRVFTTHIISCATCTARMMGYFYHWGALNEKNESAARSDIVKQWNARKEKQNGKRNQGR